MNESIFDNYWIILLIIIAAIWELAWKAVGLWKSARSGHKAWFIAILVINSIGILPIIYIFIHQKKSW